MYTFLGAEGKLGGKDKKKIENNTYLERIDQDCIGVSLHGHTLIEIHRDGRYRLTSCGYRTLTTKTRINDHSPFSVSQKNHTWYCHTKIGTYLFRDGMVFSSDGEPVTREERTW